MTDRDVTLIAVGDIGPLREDSEFLFEPTKAILRAADITFGQLEKNLSDRGTPQLYLNKTMGRTSPHVAEVLADAGFDVLSFASNHTLSHSAEALFDTIDNVTKNGIRLIGAGRNIAEARRPAIFEINGARIGILAYCSVVPKNFHATDQKPGLAPVRVSTYYDQHDWQPGTPPLIVTQANPDDLEAMRADIQALRSEVDVLIVSQHWGVHFVPAVIAQYQFEVGHAAIDAGADLIIGHHAHILKGIEIYNGKPIFYSIGNFAIEHPIELLNKSEMGDRLKPYGLTIDPEYVRFAFPRDSEKTMLLKVTIADGRITRVAFLPAWVNKWAQTEVLRSDDPRFTAVLDYLKWLCSYHDLETRFATEGDEIVVLDT